VILSIIRQLNEISEFVPNVNMTTNNDFSSIITIRGVGSASRNIGFDARVGLYLDGVYVGQPPASNKVSFDVAPHEDRDIKGEILTIYWASRRLCSIYQRF
jgi:hypothetical protein